MHYSVDYVMKEALFGIKIFEERQTVIAVNNEIKDVLIEFNLDAIKMHMVADCRSNVVDQTYCSKKPKLR